MWARIHLIPALQAEEDRDQVRRYLADKAREKELLGTETRVYNSDRCVLTLLFTRGLLLIRIAGSCDQPSPSHPRTRQSRGGLIGQRRHGGCNCTYNSRRTMEVGMVPLVAVPHREMHDNRIYVFFGLIRLFLSMLRFCDEHTCSLASGVPCLCHMEP